MVAAGTRVPAGATAAHGDLIDVAPTIMAAAGLDVPDGLDGRVLEGMVAR